MTDPTPTTEGIDRQLLLDARTGEVWRVITGHGWLAEEVQIDPVPGSEAQFVSAGSVRSGWIEEARPPEDDGPAELVFWWSAPDEPASRVEIALEPQEEGTTLLRVAETWPLEVLDLVGVPLPGSGGGDRGPALLAAA